MEDLLQWHYADSSGSFGPYPLTHIKDLITEGKISGSTMLWKGQGEWKPARETELGYLFIAPTLAATPASVIPSVPAAPAQPVQTPSGIHNGFVWALAAVPIIGIVIYAASGFASKLVFFVIFFVLNSLFFWLDQKMLKERGHPVPASKWANVIPVYLWQRAKALNQRKFYVWIWVITFSYSISVIFTTPSQSNDTSPEQRAAINAQLSQLSQGTSQTAQESNADNNP